MSLLEHAARSPVEHAEARLRFLMESGTRLDASLDLPTTLETLATVLVPRLGDVCLIDMVRPDDRAERCVVRHVDPEMQERLWSLTRRWPGAFDSSGVIRETIRSGRTHFTPQVSAEFVGGAFPDPEQRALVLSMEYRSAIIVPLAAHGRTLGTITLCLVGPTGPLYTARDVVLLEDLARRASLAVDNSGLYTDRARVAQILQSSLMPSRLPEVPHLDTAVRFRSAGDGTELGGDFYDVFSHRPGRWTAVVGDVCGKGATAAAVTALARHTVRAVARYEDGPVGVLHALHRAVVEQSARYVFCTAAVVEARPTAQGCVVRVARGGHPPALVLRADGRVETVDPAGPLLGALDEVEFAEASARLAVGDALVLYTDGVIEAGAPEAQLGEEWLAATLATLAGRDADAVAEEITRRVLEVEGDRPGDDIAVLVLRSC